VKYILGMEKIEDISGWVARTAQEIYEKEKEGKNPWSLYYGGYLDAVRVVGEKALLSGALFGFDLATKVASKWLHERIRPVDEPEQEFDEDGQPLAESFLNRAKARCEEADKVVDEFKRWMEQFKKESKK